MAARSRSSYRLAALALLAINALAVLPPLIYGVLLLVADSGSAGASTYRALGMTWIIVWPVSILAALAGLGGAGICAIWVLVNRIQREDSRGVLWLVSGAALTIGHLYYLLRYLMRNFPDA